MKIYKHLGTLVLLLTIVGVSVSYSQQPRVSQRGHVEQTIGTTVIKITYHRPNKKGRGLWGDGDALVPNGKVWRAGANEATVFETTADITVNGKALAAGKYSFYTIPWAKDWTIIFNKDWEQWGTIYKEESDALRVSATSLSSEESKETMTFSFEDVGPDSATVVLAWGTTRVPFTVSIGK